jgi:hypothetical protein
MQGDRVLLQQVVLNLIINAMEAMSGKGLRLKELLISSDKGKYDEVTVSVRDTGTGLDPQSTERILEAFFTTKKNEGGLGLSISRTIIEAHGGDFGPCKTKTGAQSSSSLFRPPANDNRKFYSVGFCSHQLKALYNLVRLFGQTQEFLGRNRLWLVFGQSRMLSSQLNKSLAKYFVKTA